MSEGDAIRELNRLINSRITGTFTGEVKSVDEAKGIAEVLHNEFVYKARLRSVIDGELYLLLVPKVGTRVLCAPEGNSQERFVVIAHNQIVKLIYKGGNLTYTIDDDAKMIEIVNDKVKQTYGVDEIETTADQAKFNIAGNKFEVANAVYDLKSAFNDLITEIKTAIVTTPSGAGTISPTTITKLEIVNTKINELLK